MTAGTTAMAEGLKGLTQHDKLGRGLLISIVIWCVMLLTNMVLFLAFDLPDARTREDMWKGLFDSGVLALRPCWSEPSTACSA